MWIKFLAYKTGSKKGVKKLSLHKKKRLEKNTSEEGGKTVLVCII